MRPPALSLKSIAPVGFALSLLIVPATSRATNMLTAASQGGGSMWEQSIWRTNLTLGGTFTMAAGNTYTVISNATPYGNNVNSARLRNNITNANNVITFKGDSLTLTTNTDIRFKNITTPASTPLIANFPGVGGNPGLILSGGVLNTGDDGNYFVGGSIQVANQSYLCTGDNGGGATLRPNRRFNISGVLSGSGTLYIFDGLTNFPNSISNLNNTFNGQWIVKHGWLQGATANSLGTNSITCDPKYPYPTFFSATAPVVDIATNVGATVRAMLEANYLLNSAGVLTLTNGGMMRLHGEAVFSDVVIEGTHLSPGVHYYPELFASFPANFDDGGLGAGGSGALVVQPYGTPPPLPPTIIKQPISTFAYADGVARFVVTASDSGFPPLTYQWRSNGVNITSSRFFGANASTLVISNPAPSEAVNYDVVINNASFPVTSSVVSLTIATPTGEAYEAAVRAAKPVAFYQLNDPGDPATNNSPAFDFAGGYYGIYGVGVQNGNPTYSIAGPGSGDGYPGFNSGNAAALTQVSFPNNRITAIPWNLNANTVTLMAWVNPSSAQNPNEGLVFCRGGTTVAGLGYSTAASLGYNWNNEPDTFNWNSGLTAPVGQWSLVALVVTPTKATVYLLTTNIAGQLTLSAAQHVYNHAVLAFEGTTLIGDDPAGTGGNRSFNGRIDDVSVFNRELSPGELLGLFSAASATSGYLPQIAVQPVSLSLFQTQTAQFTALAVGSDPLTYQWQSAPTGSGGPYNNVTDVGKFSGSATPTLTITSADFAEAADYILVASNGSGPATSSVANLTISATNAAGNVTLTVQEPSGNDWDIGANSPGANTNWSDFNPASYSAAQSPGNTYELLPGSRLRSPDGPVITTFPGRQLTVDGDSVWNVNPGAGATIAEIRFKQHTYGAVNGVVNIPKLVMNGGQLDVGNDFTLVLNGEIDILTNTPINNDAGSDRGYLVNSYLTGSGNIEYHGYNTTFQSNFVNNLNIAGNTNTFSGQWNVVTGTLLGTGNKALGTNHIFVGANGALETTYDIANTNAYLVLAAGSKMFLHQTNRFRSAVVSGISLPAGTNTFATLNANFPSNFPAIWAPKTGATNFTAGSGMIIVFSNAAPLITSNPRSITNRGQQTATFSVAAVGGNPLGYQWRAGAAGSGTFTNLFNAGNISGATNATLTITNLVAANAGDYLAVVTNAFGAATSSIARLTELSPPFITLQPLSQTNSGTLTANFFASALGDLPMTYQWQEAAVASGGPYTNVSGSQYVGGNTTNLTVNSLAISNSADLIIIFSNFAGSVTSTVATLTVIDPLITQQPTPTGTLNRYQTASASWSVAILGTAPLISKWQGGAPGSGIFTNMINGPLVSGATTTTLRLNSVDFGDAGDYRYIVSNPDGSVTSSVVSLTVSATSPAQNYTLDFDMGPGSLPIQQVAGNDWNTLNHWNPDGEAASTSAEARPGSHYHVVGGARLRSPVNAVFTNFAGGDFTPGIQLIIEGNGVFTNSPGADYTNSAPPANLMGEIRFKHGNPGTNYIKQLIMNGGQIDNADNGQFVLKGEIDVLATTPFYVDSAAGQDRNYQIDSWLTGTGTIEWRQFTTALGGPDMNITCPTNTFSGRWHVFAGTLLGSGANSLGTNSITVETGGALETAYDLNTPTANLTLNGQMFLHQNDTFRTLTLGNYLVPGPATYTYGQLAASFPGSFPGAWALQAGSSVNTASGSITVLAGQTVNTISNSFTVVGNTLSFSGTGGLANGKYYVLSSTNVALPKASWVRSGPFPFDNLGNFGTSVPIVSTNKQQFFQLQQIVP